MPGPGTEKSKGRGYARVAGHHIIVGHREGISARWRRAGVVAAALALPLAASGIAAAPASAAGGYMVTRTIPVGSSPFGVAGGLPRTAYVANYNSGTVSVIRYAGVTGGAEQGPRMRRQRRGEASLGSARLSRRRPRITLEIEDSDVTRHMRSIHNISQLLRIADPNSV